MSDSLRGKRWIVPPQARAEASPLAGELHLPPALAQLLWTRGHRTAAAAAAFLSPPALDPLTLPDMATAVHRLARAAAGGEGVLLFGDYDCDGICGTALLYEALGACGLRVAVHLPQRADGYGMQAGTLPGLAAAAGCQLVLAVDNGSTAHAAIAAAQAAGMEVLVAGHHQLDAEVPPALAVINPRRAPRAPGGELAGVGVAWMLAQALAAALGRPLPPSTDLVALGSIADVVPLRAATRHLALQGLLAMAGPDLRPGLRAALVAAGVPPGQRPTARDISHGVAPLLNAPGRVGSPAPALDLLLARTEPAALAALTEVQECNRRRQELSAALLAAAEVAAAAQPAGSRALVLADAGWQLGLLGPVASRLSERWQIPVLLAEIGAGGLCRGSGRAPGGWDLTAALRQCAAHLRRFGGHAGAAGFEVTLESLDGLRAALTDLAPPETGAGREWALDGILNPDDLEVGLAEALEALEPVGADNPPPAFLLQAVTAMEVRRLGRDQRHLRCRLRLRSPAGRSVDAVGFDLGTWAAGIAAAGAVDVVVTPEVDRYRGRATLRLRILDLAPAEGGWRSFADAARRDLARTHPDREALAAIFRRLRTVTARRPGPLPPTLELLPHLVPACLPHADGALAALEIFREAGLIDTAGCLVDPPPGRKVDLAVSARFRAGQQARHALATLDPQAPTAPA